jgi:hypothetical protein
LAGHRRDEARRAAVVAILREVGIALAVEAEVELRPPVPLLVEVLLLRAREW